MIRALVLSLLLAFPLMAQDQAVSGDPEALADPVQEARARELMKEIRCLVCQNQSIEDSDAGLAKDLRMIVREKIAEGMSDNEIKQWLVDRYGDWVLLEPPLDMRTWFLWGSPFLLMAGVGLWLWRRPKKTAGAKPLTDAEQAELDRLLGKAGDE